MENKNLAFLGASVGSESPFPEISVVIPVHNRSELLRQCLESLSKQNIPQEAFEVIICDDGSSENLAEVLGSFAKNISHLRWLRQEQKGPAAARNLGIHESVAPFIVFLDSDIVPDPGMVRALAETLKKNPGWMGAEAKLELIGEEGPLWNGPSCSLGGRYHTAAIAYRRDALMAVGGFDEAFKLPACEDADLAARILFQGPIHFVPKAVARHPVRRVTWKTHWRWRQHWKYMMILAKRHGFLGFPGFPVGCFPRLRVAWSAVATQPTGRFIEAWKKLGENPKECLIAALLAIFDVFCGLWALPDILFRQVPNGPDPFPSDPSLPKETNPR